MHLRPGGAVNVELTIGSKTLLTTFFVLDGKGTSSLLLGHDQIHTNCCIPSTIHQCLIQWQGDNVEMVEADTSISVATVDPAYWEFEDCECFSGRIQEGGVIRVNDERQKPIQVIGSESLF